MSKPELLIIAGCNGSGKSSYSKALTFSRIQPFDYDYYFLKFYNSLRSTDFQDKMAHNMAYKELKNQIYKAIQTKNYFCFEYNVPHQAIRFPLW